jgi:hypothetical protein
MFTLKINFLKSAFDHFYGKLVNYLTTQFDILQLTHH